MWASGETDEPKKFSSGAWLLRTSGEIDERRCWTTWATFKGGSPGVSQFGYAFLVYPCVRRLPVVFPHMRGPVIYPLSIKH
jgi:hypothetical protein